MGPELNHTFEEYSWSELMNADSDLLLNLIGVAGSRSPIIPDTDLKPGLKFVTRSWLTHLSSRKMKEYHGKITSNLVTFLL